MASVSEKPSQTTTGQDAEPVVNSELFHTAEAIAGQVLEITQREETLDKEKKHRLLDELLTNINLLLTILQSEIVLNTQSLQLSDMQLFADVVTTAQLCFLDGNVRTRLHASALSGDLSGELEKVIYMSDADPVMAAATDCLQIVSGMHEQYSAEGLVRSYNAFVALRDEQHTRAPYTTKDLRLFSEIQTTVQAALLGMGLQLSLEKKQQKIEVPERATAEGLVLIHRDITFLKDALRSHTSGGSACVPLSYAYLQILKDQVADRGEQEKIIKKIMKEWKEKHNSDWVFATAFIDDTDSREAQLNSYAALNTSLGSTGIPAIDGLITYFSTAKDSVLQTYAAAQITPITTDLDNRSIIMTTAEQLEGKVVYVDPQNPHWKGMNKNAIPKIGENTRTAGKHALLVIDHKQLPQGGHEFYMIDPMTGSVLAVNVQELVRRVRTKENVYLQAAQITTGTCLVG